MALSAAPYLSTKTCRSNRSCYFLAPFRYVVGWTERGGGRQVPCRHDSRVVTDRSSHIIMQISANNLPLTPMPKLKKIKILRFSDPDISPALQFRQRHEKNSARLETTTITYSFVNQLNLVTRICANA